MFLAWLTNLFNRFGAILDPEQTPLILFIGPRSNYSTLFKYLMGYDLIITNPFPPYPLLVTLT